MNFPDLWPFNHRSDEEVTMKAFWWLTYRPTHWRSQICCRRLFKIWPSTVTPNDPKMTSDQKFLHTPKEPLVWPMISSPKFHQNLLNHVDEEAFWAYLNNDPKWPLDDLWPQISEHPKFPPPTWWSLCSSIMKIHQDIREEAFFLTALIVNGYTDTYTDRYTDTPVCHKLIAQCMS